MAKFGVITTDEIIFAGDKTRIDVSKSFVTPEADYTLEVKADAAEDYIVVTNDRYLDWVYSTAGDKTISVKVDSDVFTKEITVLDLTTSNLFSKDSDLIPYEPLVLENLPAKWSSFNVVHYKVKDHIMKWIDKKGFTATDGSKLTDESVVDIQEVKDLAIFLALNFIYAGLSNAKDDIFAEKAANYAASAIKRMEATSIRLDTNLDGTVEDKDLFVSTLQRV